MSDIYTSSDAEDTSKLNEGDSDTDLINLFTCEHCKVSSVEDDQPPLKKARTESGESEVTEDDGSVSPGNSTDSDGIVGSQESQESDRHRSEMMLESITGVDKTDISFEWSVSCSTLQKMKASTAFQKLCVKRFIVNEDYILFPYCIKTKEGTLVRPEEMRVSALMKQRYASRYAKIKEKLSTLDSVINEDTSNPRSIFRLHNSLRSFNVNEDEVTVRQFLDSVEALITDMYIRQEGNIESQFRTMFGLFISIIMTRGFYCEHKTTKPLRMEVNLPLIHERLKITGKPDILIKHKERGILAAVECKKYYEMKMTFDNVPEPHKTITAREASKVHMRGILKEHDKPVRVLHERLYKDLDRNVCRYMTDSEKKYLNHFLAQIIGEILVCGPGQGVPIHMLLQTLGRPKKVVRYGIGQVGFKIFFVTVGLNGDFDKGVPYITVGDSKAHGLDVFCTRPMDLMVAKDRNIIAETLFAVMHGKF